MSTEHALHGALSRCSGVGRVAPSNVEFPLWARLRCEATHPMTPHSSKPMTGAEFENRLHQLVTEGRNRNAPIAGAYSIRSPDPEAQDYDVEITKVTNRFPTMTGE